MRRVLYNAYFSFMHVSPGTAPSLVFKTDEHVIKADQEHADCHC